MNRNEEKGEVKITEEIMFAFHHRDKLAIIARAFGHYIRLKLMPHFSFKGVILEDWFSSINKLENVTKILLIMTFFVS